MKDPGAMIESKMGVGSRTSNLLYMHYRLPPTVQGTLNLITIFLASSPDSILIMKRQQADKC